MPTDTLSDGLENTVWGTIDACGHQRATLTELLSEFSSTLTASPDSPFQSEAEYWASCELLFAVRAMLLSSLATLDGTMGFAGSMTAVGDAPRIPADSSTAEAPNSVPLSQARLMAMRDLVTRVEATKSSRVAATAAGIASNECTKLREPRVVRLAKAYEMSPETIQVVELLVVMYTAKSKLFRAQLAKWNSWRDSKAEVFMNFCGMSQVGVSAFLDTRLCTFGLRLGT